jgi:hypothetical protein
VLAGLVSLAFLLFLRTHQHRLEEEAERALPGSLDDYRKARKDGKLSRASQFLSQTPRYTESSHQRAGELIGEEQAMAPVDETFEHMGQAFAASNHSARKTVFHKIILQKETVIHE